MKTSVLNKVVCAVIASGLVEAPAWAAGLAQRAEDTDGQLLALALGVVGAVGLMRRRIGASAN